MIFFKKFKLKKNVKTDEKLYFFNQKRPYLHLYLNENLKKSDTLLPIKFLENTNNPVIKKLDHKKTVGNAHKRFKHIQPTRRSDNCFKFNSPLSLQKNDYSTLTGDEISPENSECTPAQNGASTAPKRLKAHFRHIDPTTIAKGSKCLMTLSIGQKVHYGEYLAATLHEVEKFFSECIFVVGDTLQRHTQSIVLNQDPDALRANTRQTGDQWIEQNIKTLAHLNIPWKIIRWDNLLKNAIFKKKLAMLKFSYETNKLYKNEIDKNVDEFILRTKRRNEMNCDENIARQRCLDYLLEECTIMLLWLQEGCQYELYPNGRLGALQATYNHFIAPLDDIAVQPLLPLSMRFKEVIFQHKSAEMTETMIGRLSKLSNKIQQPAAQHKRIKKNLDSEINFTTGVLSNTVNNLSDEIEKIIHDHKKDVQIFMKNQNTIHTDRQLAKKLKKCIMQNFQQQSIRQFHGTQEVLPNVQRDNIEPECTQNTTSSLRPQ